MTQLKKANQVVEIGDINNKIVSLRKKINKMNISKGEYDQDMRNTNKRKKIFNDNKPRAETTDREFGCFSIIRRKFVFDRRRDV